MLTRARTSGFSLIELMIAIAVLGALLAAGVPAFMNWIQNSQIRVAAESVRNGLQLARTEAVRLNTRVRFQLTEATESGWKVNPLDDPDRDPPIAIRTHSDGSGNVTVAALPAGSAEIVFEPLGTVSNSGGTAPLARIDFSNPLITSTDDRRELRIIISSNGQAKMCDPKVLTSNDPRKCP
ncbi:MAG: GspH/FimT family pseudopilin [Betaproteobacteria bacterium]|nr:GspH/FimT family pseudopilin [Betaproteobacteria bacterium]